MVYEAKMAFFVRLAASRDGAERLLDAQTISVLGQCESLAATAGPDSMSSGALPLPGLADRADYDDGSFLPSPLERHQSIVLPALQVVSALVSTLGAQNTVAMAQARAFVADQRDVILFALGSVGTSLTFTAVYEVQLIATIMRHVVRDVPDSEFVRLRGARAS